MGYLLKSRSRGWRKVRGKLHHQVQVVLNLTQIVSWLAHVAPSPQGRLAGVLLTSPILGNSRFRMVSKDNLGATQVTLDRRTNVETDTVVIWASVCGGQIQVVVRRPQTPKGTLLVSRRALQNNSWEVERGEAAPPIPFTYITEPKKAGGTRSGDLSLRQQRLTKPMLHALRTDPAHVQMDLLQQAYDKDGVSQNIVNRRGGKYRAPPNEFLFLRMRIRNVSRGFRPPFRVVHDV